VGSPVALSGGSASYATSSLTAGSHTVAAVYGGDPDFTGSTGNLSPDQQVDAATSSVALTSAPNPSVYLSSATLTATITPSTALGTVQFFEGVNPLGSATVTSGSAVLAVSSLTVGTHSLTATFTSDGNYSPSTSPAHSHEVKAQIVATAGTHGVIAPAGTTLYSLNDNQTFTITPDAGYHVGTLTVDGGGQPVVPGVMTYTFTSISANHTIDAQFTANPAVGAIASLAASQVKTPNDDDGTIKLKLHWDEVIPSGSTVEVYRAPFGHYPEYDDLLGAPPLAPSYPPSSPWAPTAVTASDQTDEVSNGPSGFAGRDVWYYVAFVTDSYGTHSAVSNMTVGVPNYLLGDVADGTPAGLGRGDNMVDLGDISALGGSYGFAGPAVDPVDYLDVGPTSNHYVDGIPLTDNSIDFEDLVLFAINYGVGGAPQPQAARTTLAAAKSGTDRLAIDAPRQVVGGQEYTVRLDLEGTGRIQALSAGLIWKVGVVEPVGFVAGEWLTQLDGVAFSPKPGAVDMALLGARESGFAGQGVVATVRFRALAAGDPQLALGAVVARDAANQKVDLETAVLRVEPKLPTVTALSMPYPNPFRGASTIGFSLAQAEPVTVGVYGVDGRLVRTLASGRWEPGVYRLEWNGRDEQGNPMSTGIYFVQMTTGHGRFAKKITYLR
jgi:hypothetical protein